MNKKDLIDILIMLPLAWLGALGKTTADNKMKRQKPWRWLTEFAENLVAACIVAVVVVPLARLLNVGDYVMCLGAIFGGYAGFGLLEKIKIELENWLKRRYGNADD